MKKLLPILSLVGLLVAQTAFSATIGDLVWRDDNGNTVQNGSEPGIDGVDVFLYNDADCDTVVAGDPDADASDAGDTLAQTATTAGGGAYSFTVGVACYALRVDEGGLATSTPNLSNPGLTTGHQTLGVRIGGSADVIEKADFGYVDSPLQIIEHTAPNLVIDSNLNPPGPDVFVIGTQVCNNTSSTMPDVVAYVGDGTTPGMFPVTSCTVQGDGSVDCLTAGGVSWTVRKQNAYSGDFSLRSVDEVLNSGGSAPYGRGTNGTVGDTTRNLGDIPANTCVGVYWEVQYDRTDASGNPTFGSPNDPGQQDPPGYISDDLEYEFAIWAESGNGDSFSISDLSIVRSEQSASANKIQPNGQPPSQTLLTINGGTPQVYDGSYIPDVAPGQTITITYVNATFGNIGAGFDGDGDGLFDYDFWYQPIGNVRVNPQTARLTEVGGEFRGSCNSGNFVFNLTDNPYATNTDRYGNCSIDSTYSYTYTVLSIGSAIVAPYQEAASGSNNEKYNGDYCGDVATSDLLDTTNSGFDDERQICVPINFTNPPNIQKGVDDTEVDSTVDGEQVVLTYTMTYSNNTTTPIGNPETGNPVVIMDSIPILAGTDGNGSPTANSYVAGSASCSTGLPNGCTIQYSTDDRATWSSNEPADPTTVTDLRWAINDPVPAPPDPNASGTVTYQLQVDNRLGANNGWHGVILNLAQIHIDDGPVLDEDEAITCVDVTPCTQRTTAVFLTDFTTYDDNGRVVVQWETAAEVGTVGFYLERKDPATGEFVRLNDELLLGLLHSPVGGTYRYLDETAVAGETYTYQLVEVEASGNENRYGPYTVTATTSVTGFTPDEGRFGALVSGYMRQARGLSDAQKVRIAARKAAKKSKGKSKNTAAQAAKIAVKDPGLYFLAAEEINTVLGASGNALKGNNLVMGNHGRTVATLPAADGSGIFFYGQGITSNYTNENVYTLTQGRGMVMQEVAGKGPQPASDDQTFSSRVHLEEDNLPVLILTDDPESDYWYWQFVAGQYRFPDPAGLLVETPGRAANGTAILTVNLQALNVLPEHRVQVSVNGTLLALDVDSWGGQEAHSATATFNQSLLNDGPNTVTVSGTIGGSMFYVDSFDLAYQRHYRAVGDVLRARANGNAVITISGFSSPEISVYEISDPAQPKFVTATTIDAGAGGSRVSFRAASPLAVYLALTANAALTPTAVTADTPSDLKAKNSGADYVIVTPAAFTEAAQALVNHRQGRGLSAKVVALEDVYDEFNDGIASPHAIRDFMVYAHGNWNPAPRYLLIGGNGTWDYKGRYGEFFYGEPFDDNLVPPILAATPHGLFAADNRYGDVVGDDGVPEIAVGRLPFLTEDEFKKAIAKIISYESTSTASPDTVILAADDPDDGGNFRGDSEELAALVPSTGYTIERVYLSDLSAAAARSKLRADLNGGAAVFNYIGHGASTVLADENLLNVSDADVLATTNKLPVMLALTCQAGRFDPPGHASLGEVMVLDDDGGAIAAWAPSGQSLNAEAIILNRAFFETVFSNGERILGDAVVRSLARYAEEGTQPYMLGIYNLLGDPALRMNIQ